MKYIFCTIFLLLALIQEGLLSVTSKCVCTEYWLTYKACQGKKCGYGILGQVWYLIVSIPDLCTITYF